MKWASHADVMDSWVDLHGLSSLARYSSGHHPKISHLNTLSVHCIGYFARETPVSPDLPVYPAPLFFVPPG
jgi:hypothetical protein